MERYPHEKTVEEASLMQEKMESGKAFSSEAEKITEQESPKEKGTPLSAEDIRRNVEDLKEKIRAAKERTKQEKEENIRRGISEHESLIGEMKEKNELLKEAKSALEEFESAEKLGQLDEGDTKNLNNLRETVSALENERLEIDQKIKEIFEKEGINERLQETAQGMNIKKAEEKLRKLSSEKLNPKIQELAERIKIIASDKNSAKFYVKQGESSLSNLRKEIKKVFDEAEEKLKGKSAFINELREILRQESLDEIEKKLIEIKKSLEGIGGLFKGKEKSAIDYILSNRKIFNNYRDEIKERDGWKKKEERLKDQENNLPDQFEEILEEAWKLQSEIMNQDEDKIQPIAADLKWLLENKIKEFAGLKREGDKSEKGKYNSWYEATTGNPKNEILYAIMEKVTERNPQLAYANPKKEAKQENPEKETE